MPTVYVPTFDSSVVDLDAPWRMEAACLEMSRSSPVTAAMWDTKERSSGDFKAATEICKTCPVRMSCVKDAALDATSTGNRGGFGFDRGGVLTEDADRIEALVGVRPRTRRTAGGYQSTQKAG